MKILVSGSSGLVGSQLVDRLQQDAHTVVPLVRSSDRDGVLWDPSTGKIDAAGMEGCDAVIHLAGENIADGRWSESKKDRIRTSRVAGTRMLCQALAELDSKPATLICASAVGFYGDRGNEACDESSLVGSGFLASTCLEWEQATMPAQQAGIRVVNTRLGLVLSRDGGVLAKMLTPFKLGMGAIIGNGQQFMSWISERDLISILQFCVYESSISGPVNATAPEPVTNEVFSKTLGKVLGRPVLLSVPSVVLETLLGDMAKEMLLAGVKATPTKLQQAGFEFKDRDLESTLKFLLEQKPS